jgi:hypothetical protein
MLRYRLRTLLIVLAIGPLVLWAAFWLWQWAIAYHPGPGGIIVEDWFEDRGGNKTSWPLPRKR